MKRPAVAEHSCFARDHIAGAVSDQLSARQDGDLPRIERAGHHALQGDNRCGSSPAPHLVRHAGGRHARSDRGALSRNCPPPPSAALAELRLSQWAVPANCANERPRLRENARADRHRALPACRDRTLRPAGTKIGSCHRVRLRPPKALPRRAEWSWAIMPAGMHHPGYAGAIRPFLGCTFFDPQGIHVGAQHYGAIAPASPQVPTTPVPPMPSAISSKPNSLSRPATKVPVRCSAKPNSGFWCRSCLQVRSSSQSEL